MSGLQRWVTISHTIVVESDTAIINTREIIKHHSLGTKLYFSIQCLVQECQLLSRLQIMHQQISLSLFVKEVQWLHHGYRENDGVFEGDKPNPFLPLKFPKFGKENGYPIDKNPV